jgi:hypothetical protein
MSVLALLLSIASAHAIAAQDRPAPAAAALPRAARPVTRVRIAPQPPALEAIVTEGDCTPDMRCADPDARYRLTTTDAPLIDNKQRALRMGQRECGVTGMPVCPSNTRPVLSTTLGD